MKKIYKRLFAGLLVTALTITSLYLGPTGTDAYAAGEKATIEYEIYPKPHEISYQTGEYVIRQDVNVVYEDGIDEATRNRLEEVVESKGKTMHTADAKVAKQTNILVGVYGSEDYVDTYVKENYTVDATLFTHFGSYFMVSKDDEICILGKDTDGAFYGITSLKHIFNQMDGSTIRNFTIKDYADTNTRGFIEGYYGIPWSNADRMSLMEFGGEFKMTSYVFAPKDDPYHSGKWRDPYPADKLAEIAEMAAVGNATKCKFVWTIHPFRSSAISEENYDRDIQAIITKFEQLYDAGVRQFGVLGDDAGNLPRSVVIRCMNDLQKWVESKGDVYNLVFCPAGYNHSWQGNYSELNEYDAGFAEDIQIFWTGEAVCKPVEQTTLDHFRRHNLAEGQKQRRAPLFWLNWPVNDINMSRLMMGKGSLLHPDITINDLSGVVTNPMQDAEASKVAIFAVADYAWNVAGFDDDQSWADSFKYIEKDATEALHTLAKHMSDPSPNNHGLVLGESEELNPLLQAFMTAYEAGTYDAEKAADLIAEFEVIKKACDDFHKLSQNAKLKEELLPFTNSLKDLVEANIFFIKTAAALEEGNSGEVWGNYSNATAKLTSGKNYDRPLINNGLKKALPGSKRLAPFAAKMNALLEVPVNSMVDDSKQIISFITNRTDTPDGAFERLTDNDESTEVIWKSPNSTATGTYIGITYSQPITLNDVTFKMGQSGNPRDTFASAKLQYTEDGKEWIDIEGSEYTDTRAVVSAEDLDLQVKGVRIISTADKTNMWLGCKDIIINKDSIEEPVEPEEPSIIEGTGIYNTENMVIRGGNVGMMTDGANDKNGSYVGFSKSNTNGDPDKDATVVDAWVGIQFPEATEVGSILISQGTGDHIVKGTLEYTTNGTTWTEIKSYDAIGADLDVTFEQPITAKAIRLVNKERAAIWWRIYEIVASKPGEDTTPLDKTIIKSSTWSVYSGPETNLTDGNEDTVVWYDTGATDTTVVGDFIGMDVGRVAKIGNVKFVVGQTGNGDKWSGYHLEYSTDNKNWTTFKTYTGVASGKDVVEENLDGVEAQYVRLVNDVQKKAWVKFGEISVDQYVDVTGQKSEFMYTNVPALENLAIVHTDEETHFETKSGITLKNGEYLGMKLERIKDLSNIDFTPVEGLTLQTSKNGVVWTDVTTDTYEDARYIRVINKTNADVTFNLTTFAVESVEVYPISIVDKNVVFYENGDGLNAFDKDRTTEAIWNASQTEGKYVTYDLGQTIDLDSLSLVSKDSAGDFPRHAKVSVSENGTDWTDVLFIGNQDAANAGEAEGTDNIMDVLPIHDVSSNLKTVEDLDVRARYIKVTITRSKVGPNKWTRYTEIELNGGDMFLPSENDPTVVTDAEESENNVATNVNDGSVATTFRPVGEEAGSFEYFISENTEINKVSILQSPSTISNATVTAHVVKMDGTEADVVLGTLNGSLNEFNTSAFGHVLSVKVEWTEGNVPEVHEIITSTATVATANKTALQTYYDAHKTENITTWTAASKQAYQAALAKAQATLENEYVTQTMVDDALAALTKAVGNKVVLGDFATFKAAVDELAKDVLPGENYIPRTWTVYTERLANANAAFEAKAASQDELDDLLAKLTTAKSGLVYEVNSIENLQLYAEEMQAAKNALKAADYSKSTFDALQKVLDGAANLIALDKTERQKPADVKAAQKAIETAFNNLADLTGLRAAIEEAEAKDTSIYTDASVEVLTDAITEAKEVVKNAATTKQDVADSLKAIEDAIEGLELKGDSSAIEAEITRLKKLEAADYTENSYDALLAAIADVEAALAAGDTDYTALAKQLSDAEDALVETAELKAAIAVAENIDADRYTPESKATLTEKVNAAKALLANGTEATIAEAITAMEAAKAQLVLTEAVVNAAVKPYEEALDNGSYTTASAEALQDAIDDAKSGELTEAQLAEKLANLETVKDALVSIKALLAAMEKAEDDAVQLDKTLYTAASYAAYQEAVAKAVEAAQALLENGTVTQIADAIEVLENAKDLLVKVGAEEDVDTSKLQALVDKYSKLDLSKYTDATAKALRDELELAKFMISSGDATQTQIDARVKALEKAYTALVLKPTGGSTDKPGNGAAQTGDGAMTMVFVLLMMAGLAYVALFERKRRV